MTVLDYEQTKRLIFLVLDQSEDNQIRKKLHAQLKRIDSNEAQFYAGIVEHGLHMKLASEQWFKLLSLLPTRMLRSGLPIQRILSPRHFAKLPPSIG